MQIKATFLEVRARVLSQAEKFVKLIYFHRHKYWNWLLLSCFEARENILTQYSLMLMHLHTNILDNINLADVANEFVNRKDSRKQTFRQFFLKITHNIRTIKFTLYYKMYITWGCNIPPSIK